MFLLAVTGYVVASFALAAPWHLVWFHDKYVALGAFTRGDPIMPFGVLAMALQGMVFAYFDPLLYQHQGGRHPIFYLTDKSFNLNIPFGPMNQEEIA